MMSIFGRVLSPGIAVGKALVKSNHHRCELRYVNNPAEEVVRLEKALHQAFLQLESLKNNDLKGAVDSLFIDAHILIAKDPVMKSEVTALILKDSICAEYAFSSVIDHYIALFEKMDNEYLRDRYVDIKDIRNRVLHNLYDISVKTNYEVDTILILDELYPSLLINISPRIKGVVALKGGSTSHSAILCNAMDIPYIIVDDHDLVDGDDVIIDANRGIVLTHPSIDMLQEYEYLSFSDDIDVSEVVLDHGPFTIRANIGSNREIGRVISNNCDGVGLYRTEYIFMASDQPPQMEDQQLIYNEILERIYPHPVLFRTFDLGDDKQVEYLKIDTKSVENYRNYPHIFKSQIEALIQANTMGNLYIMFPMIRTPEEYIELREIVYQTKKELNNMQKVNLGMMLETKDAFENIDSFVGLDFISIGTNDLVYELFNIPRESLSSYHAYESGIMTAISVIKDYADRNKVELSICGELASYPEALQKMIDMGIRSFSVSIKNMRRVEQVIKKNIRRLAK